MNETLRPSTLGEILDRTFQLYRNNFWRFVGIAALPLVAASLLLIPIAGLWFAAVSATPGIHHGGSALTTMVGGIGFVLAYIIFLPLYLGAYSFSIAGITQATVGAHRGERPTIRAVLKSVRPRFWSYFWYFLLQWIMACLVPMCAAGVLIVPPILLVSRSGIGLGVGFALGFLVFVVGAATIGAIAWLALSFAMGMAVCVVEKKTAWQSLKRSWRLSQGTRGRIFVLYLLILALAFVVVMISYFLAAVIAVAAAFIGHDSRGAAIAVIVAAIVYVAGLVGTQIAIVPVPWIALVLFYYDQRIRKEGYDIEWMMQQAGLVQPPSAAPPGDDASGGAGVFPSVTPPDTLG
jgi:hypothetical protein